MNLIKISQVDKFYLFSFPNFKFKVATLDNKSQKYYCDLDDSVIISNTIFFIDLKKNRFTKLIFKKYSCKKPIFKIQYPVIFKTVSMPKLGIPICVFSKPIDVNNRPISIKNKPVALQALQSINITYKPVDLIIVKNLTICQTHLNHQIQLCPILDL